MVVNTIKRSWILYKLIKNIMFIIADIILKHHEIFYDNLNFKILL